ncbi:MULTISPECIES: multidrug transporter subunit MdtD [Acinetobacter]|uniref:multidrug transporter subunit MdtD n=1 Tax=Acinetobacter TaxID=469 RepID=UPI000B3C5A16|nr:MULTISPECIES: multidrug transporter subunit MdtD [Acinetobacter]AWA49177.1 DHA2 family efflux MFS transporter permease subunit [Acinetobacter junii]MDI6622337.1 multidrug transporter subunit MdtD [Acinetobacter junii]
MTTTTHQAVQPEFRLLVLLVSIGFFMQALDTTIVNTAIPAMAVQLNEDPLQMHGVIVAYVLSVAACIPLSGWLADRFGIRNIYLSSMVIFGLASLGCGLSQNLDQLLFFRVIQGIGGALLMPVGRLALLKLIPRSQFLSAMSLMSLAGLIGPLMGPTLGGWLVEVTTWHWIFLINIPMGVFGMIMTFKVMPNQKEPSVKAFDLSGFILLMIAMVGLSLGIENIAAPQYSGLVSISLLVAGTIATVAYAYHAHSHQNALFHGRLFRYKIFSIGVLGNFFARLGSNAIPFILPLMLQVAFGFEPFITGLMMIPMVLGSLFSKPIIRPIIQRVGYRRFLLTNTVLVGLCIASFALMTADTPQWLKILHLFIFGTLNSLQFVGMNTLTLKDLPQHDASSGNSFLSMIMMLSMSIGVALAGTLINVYGQHFPASSITTAFHATLISLGCINIITAWIFWQIPKETTD